MSGAVGTESREESPPSSPVVNLMDTDCDDHHDLHSPPPSLVDFMSCNFEQALGIYEN